MHLEELSLSHPHDFFGFKQIGVQHGTCFVLMPFAQEFELVYETIVEALRGLMVCTRADDLKIGKPILERILRGIVSSEMIIADLTGRNPNVFYELALAHTRTKNVLLLTQSMEDIPFDLRSYFCHLYKRNSQADLKELENIVRDSAKEVLAKRMPRTLRTPIIRTKRIVDHMGTLLRQPDGFRDLLIRIQASISSLGNSGILDSEDTEVKKYGHLLEDERKQLIELVVKGARLEAIISPYRISPDPMETVTERNDRIDRVISFLQQKDQFVDRCEFVISPSIGANQIFFGKELLFEGHKTKVERGFGWTEVFSDKEFLGARIKVFDQLFESARQYTLKKYGAGLDEEKDSKQLRASVVRCLEEAKNSKQPI